MIPKRARSRCFAHQFQSLLFGEAFAPKFEMTFVPSRLIVSVNTSLGELIPCGLAGSPKFEV